MRFKVDPSNIYVALLHQPVYNKSGIVVTTAITNLDLHDIARTSKTFGLGGYYVVNQMPAQRELAGRILKHWVEGFGAEYNPNRGEALGVIKVVAAIEDAKADIQARHGVPPKVVATAARRVGETVGYADMRRIFEGGGPYLVVFGTGWGLTEDFLATVDYMLEPIEGPSGYNHLSVRAASAIILDRLLGNRV